MSQFQLESHINSTATLVVGDTRYEFFETGDGSPSICLSSPRFRAEAMHHREGALAESLFVYDGVLSEALSLGCPPTVLSVGLGCGYNEMIAVAHLLSKQPTLPADFYLESFEGDDNLRENFKAWLEDKPLAALESILPSRELNHKLQQTFTHVLKTVAHSFRVEAVVLKENLKNLLVERRLVVREWLTEQTNFHTRFGVIFFDAFSSKSTPELWDENFICAFLERAAAPACGLATYAATGSLNRALRRSGFSLREQKGFSFKRESTRAFRGPA